MEVCSPKDGFVAKLLVEDGKSVAQGMPLVELDSTLEEIEIEHATAREAIRVLKTEQFKGSQLKVLQTLADAAVSVAQANVNIKTRELKLAETGRALGGNNDLSAEDELSKAKGELDRVRAQRKQLDFAVARNLEVDKIAKRLADNRLAFLRKRKERMTITAPISGKVSFLVGPDSFAALGSALLEIT